MAGWHEPNPAPEHELVTATPRTAVCACGAMAWSWVPLGAIEIINDHAAKQGGNRDY